MSVVTPTTGVVYRYGIDQKNNPIHYKNSENAYSHPLNLYKTGKLKQANADLKNPHQSYELRALIQHTLEIILTTHLKFSMFGKRRDAWLGL